MTPSMSAEDRAQGLIRNITKLLDIIGKPTICKGCGKQIWHVWNSKTRRYTPYTEEALNHFIDCPNAADFRKASRASGG